MDLDLKINGMVAASRRLHQFPKKAENTRVQGHKVEPGVSHDPRPQEVPPLNLGKLGDWDDEDVSYVPLSGRHPRLGPPDSASTLSWGTARSHQLALKPGNKTPVAKKPPQWEEEKVVPENLPPPSERYRMKYQQYEEELRENFRQHSQRTQQIGTGEAASDQSQQSFVCADDLMAQDERALLQQCYTSKPYTPLHSLRKVEAEDVAVERRKQAVVEQVMVDQLSRAVISDPEQNSDLTEASSLPGMGSVPLRFRKRTLHETKVKTRSALTENLLSNKLRFDARILSRNGRDASRELIGFFFAYDKTLTIYEYRQFGKNRSNALPFIPKGRYKHECGRRQGAQYSLHDIYVGANLSFSTHGQNFPENMKTRSLLLLRVTDVDELVKKTLLTSTGDIRQGLSKEELDDRNVFMAVQGFLQERLKGRGVRTRTGLGKILRDADVSGQGILGKEQIRSALEAFHLTLPNKEFDAVWRILDQRGSGRVDYGEFVRGVMGEMNEFRKAFVRKAFMKLDPNKSGSVSMTDIEKFYCAKGHPKVLSGEASEEELRAGFMESLWGGCLDPREVSYCEFEDYYEGLSIGILDDQDFINVLKNSWGI